VSKNGGHGLLFDIIIIYIEHNIASENSITIRKVDTEYDQIENIIASGVNKLPLFLINIK